MSPSPLHTTFLSSRVFLLFLLPFLLTCSPVGDTSVPLAVRAEPLQKPGKFPQSFIISSPCQKLNPLSVPLALAFQYLNLYRYLKAFLMSRTALGSRH